MAKLKTKAEKKAFRQGVLFMARNKKNSKKTNRHINKKHSTGNIDKASDLFIVCSRYAEHMGRKYNLSSSEVNKNKIKHYKQALRDSEFRNYLFNEYGIGLRGQPTIKQINDKCIKELNSPNSRKSIDSIVDKMSNKQYYNYLINKKYLTFGEENWLEHNAHLFEE